MRKVGRDQYMTSGWTCIEYDWIKWEQLSQPTLLAMVLTALYTTDLSNTAVHKCLLCHCVHTVACALPVQSFWCTLQGSFYAFLPRLKTCQIMLHAKLQLLHSTRIASSRSRPTAKSRDHHGWRSRWSLLPDVLVLLWRTVASCYCGTSIGCWKWSGKDGLNQLLAFCSMKGWESCLTFKCSECLKMFQSWQMWQCHSLVHSLIIYVYQQINDLEQESCKCQFIERNTVVQTLGLLEDETRNIFWPRSIYHCIGRDRRSSFIHRANHFRFLTVEPAI